MHVPGGASIPEEDKVSKSVGRFVSSPRARAVILAVVLLGIVLRTVQYGGGTTMWMDELALALNIEERSYIEIATEPLLRKQVAPVAYVLLTKAITNVFGMSEFSLRLLPFLCGLASLILFWRLSRWFVGSTGLLFGMTLFALSPALVFYSGQVKPYACDMAGTLLVAWLAVRHGTRPPTTLRALGSGLVGAGAIVISNPAVPTAAAIAALLFVRWFRMTPRPPLAPLAALLAPWAIAALFGTVSSMWLLDPETHEYMRAFWADSFPPKDGSALVWLPRQLYGVFAFFLLSAVPSGGAQAAFVVVAALLAVKGALRLVAENRWTVWILLAPVIVAVLCSVAGLLPLRTRLSLFAGWPILLAAMVGIESLATASSLVWRRVGVATALVLVAVPLGLMFTGDSLPYRKEPIRPVLARVAATRELSDTVYVYYGAQFALEYYGPRTGIGEWIQGQQHRGEPRAYLRELDPFRGRARVWFVFTHAVPQYRELELIRSYLVAMGTIVQEIRDPSEMHGTGAWLVDLSDTSRSNEVSAETHPLPLDR